MFLFFICTTCKVKISNFKLLSRKCMPYWLCHSHPYCLVAINSMDHIFPFNCILYDYDLIHEVMQMQHLESAPCIPRRECPWRCYELVIWWRASTLSCRCCLIEYSGQRNRYFSLVSCELKKPMCTCMPFWLFRSHCSNNTIIFSPSLSYYYIYLIVANDSWNPVKLWSTGLE